MYMVVNQFGVSYEDNFAQACDVAKDFWGAVVWHDGISWQVCDMGPRRYSV